MAEQSIAERLREHATDWNGQPMADGEPAKGDPTAGLVRAAADQIDRLTKERDAARLGRDILRQQLRDAGIEPLITE